MIKFKACPRCSQGDLILDRDAFGRFLQCIQCAHIVDLAASPVEKELPKQLAAMLPTAA